MSGFDLPSECPECGRECIHDQAFITHYSQVHDPPYPWTDRTKRGHEWPTQRKKALERDGKVCQDCGSRKNLEVHHINEDGRDHRLENLKTLCKSCHMRRH
jgi:5-methylcytosine-specific restriction endonuclease McrA